MAHCAQGCFRCAATADAFQFLLDAQNQWCGKDTVHLRPFMHRVQQKLLDGRLSEEPSLFASEIRTICNELMEQIQLDANKDGFGTKQELTHRERVEGNNVSTQTTALLALIETECRMLEMIVHGKIVPRRRESGHISLKCLIPTEISKFNCVGLMTNHNLPRESTVKTAGNYCVSDLRILGLVSMLVKKNCHSLLLSLFCRLISTTVTHVAVIQRMEHVQSL